MCYLYDLSRVFHRAGEENNNLCMIAVVDAQVEGAHGGDEMLWRRRDERRRRARFWMRESKRASVKM